VRFQVLSEANIKMTVLWDIVPCSLVEVDRRFRSPYCLHYQENESHSVILMMQAISISEMSVNFSAHYPKNLSSSISEQFLDIHLRFFGDLRPEICVGNVHTSQFDYF
jgi:hypothetical protein